MNSARTRTAFAQDEPARILIVDDDQYFRQMLKIILTAQGYEVMEARSTNEAEAYLRHRPALVIVDYRLPGTDGAVWIKSLRERGLKFPIIFCSGSTYSSQVLANLRNVLQVDLILRKPIAPREFVNHLQSLLPQPSPIDAPELQAILAQAETQNLPLDSFVAEIEIESGLDAFGQRAQTTDQGSPEAFSAGDEFALALSEKEETEFALRELAQSYLKDMPSMVEAIDAVLMQAADTDQLSFVELAATYAHSMRGTAGSLGYFEISKIAGTLEDRLKQVLSAVSLKESQTEIFDLLNFLRQTIDGEQSNQIGAVSCYRVTPTPMKEQPQSSGASTKPRRVLVIDDGFGESAALCLSLRDNHQCETVAITDALKILPILEQYQPELLFIGTNTDGKSGYELCRMIRCIQKWWDLPLIIMTEDCSIETRAEIFESGASDFIARPIIESELRARLNAYLYIKKSDQTEI